MKKKMKNGEQDNNGDDYLISWDATLKLCQSKNTEKSWLFYKYRKQEKIKKHSFIFGIKNRINF